MSMCLSICSNTNKYLDEDYTIGLFVQTCISVTEVVRNKKYWFCFIEFYGNDGTCTIADAYTYINIYTIHILYR